MPHSVADEVAEIFFGVGTVPLTDELIDELVSEGWQRRDLLDARRFGFRYNRRRNSLFMGDVFGPDVVDRGRPLRHKKRSKAA
jgi:hypothetical protein